MERVVPLVAALIASLLAGFVVALALVDAGALPSRPSLVGSCAGKLQWHSAEDDFPHGCDWIISRAAWESGEF